MRDAFSAIHHIRLAAPDACVVVCCRRPSYVNKSLSELAEFHVLTFNMLKPTFTLQSPSFAVGDYFTSARIDEF
jgi:hypothetical protein